MRAVLVLLSIVLTACAVAGQTSTPITALGKGILATTEKDKWTYFTVQISTLLAGMAETDKLFFGATPYTGDADLYISKTQLPDSTECAHCILKSTSPYDEIKYIAKSDPSWPAAGQDTFYIGVHGYTQTEYTFTVWTSKTNGTLEDGVPQVGWVKWGTASDFVFYEYTLPTSENFTLSLTPRGADVDIFVTTNPNIRPIDRDSAIWHGRRIGFDTIHIGTEDPHYGGAGTKYYIGIQGFSIAGTTFSLYATTHSNYTRIMEGIELASEAFANEYKYFKFDLTSDYANHRLTFTVIPLTSTTDPDIYITRDISSGPPSQVNCEWCHAASGSDIVPIDNAPKGTYYVGVRSYGRHGHFQITATTEYHSTELNGGVATQGGVHANGYQYFRYYHGNPKETLTITVTPWRGTVELYESMTNTKPDENKHDRKGVPMGLERVLRYSLQWGESPTGYFYLAVKGNTDANFTIMASTNVTYTLLRDSRPVYYELVTNRYYRYYVFDISHEDLYNNSAIAVTVTTIFGDADLFISMTNDRPTQANYTWKSEDYLSDTIVIDTNDAKIGHHRRFYIGVLGATYTNQDTYYNIMAHKSGTAISLADGQPLHSTVRYDEYAYFRYHITDPLFRGPIKISVSTHDSDARVFVYADDAVSRPTSHHAKWRSTLFGQSFLTIPATGQDFFYIGVHGYIYGRNGSVSRTIPFTISASRSYEVLDANSGNVLRSISDVNVPDRYRFTVDDVSYYRTTVDYISVALTLISGRCRLYMNPASNRTDDESYTTPETAIYKNLSPNGNVILLLKTVDRDNWHNTWNVATYCDEASDYFISVSTATSIRYADDEPSRVYGYNAIELMEGVPMLQAAPFQDRFIYTLFLSPVAEEHKEDYIISIRMMDGKINLYASQDYNYIPNPKNYTFIHENITEDATIVLKKDKLDLTSPWGSRMFISVYGAWFPMLHGQANKFEINVYKASAPRYLTQDQPLSQIVLDDQFVHPGQSVFTHYRVLNSNEHPDDLEVFIDSCSDSPSVVPTAYGSSINWRPGPHNYTYITTSNGKYSNYFKTSAETKHEDRVFYIGVENKPNHQTARHYSIYATTLDDSRPIVSNAKVTGRVDNEQQLHYATIAFTVNLAQHPPRYRDGVNFLYQVFAREIRHEDHHRVSDINFDTPCAITRHSERMNTVHEAYDDSKPGTLEIFAGPFDPSKKYVVNILAHSESIFGLSTAYQKVYVVHGQFYEEFPNVPGGGMSPAGIFFLVMFILLLVAVAAFITYMIVGYIVRTKQGYAGFEAVPHHQIWSKLKFWGRGEKYGSLDDEKETRTTSSIQGSGATGGYGTV